MTPPPMPKPIATFQITRIPPDQRKSGEATEARVIRVDAEKEQVKP